ncbi:MKI67 FHA domain-interacting nucleolar phosphoprotein [Mortierella claussenii]|nr:MKI67 FHA domain-interacting nucleolar phosphoprotein [Mortierella claussenii]
MPATTRASSKPTAATASKRKASAPAAKETPAKKVAVAPAKKATAEKKKEEVVAKKPVAKKVTEKKTKAPVAEKKAAATEKNAIENKKTTSSKKASAVAAPTKKEEAKEQKKQEQERDQEQKQDSDDEEAEEEQQLMDDRALLKDIDSSADEDSSDDEDEEDKAAMKEDTFASMKDEISLNPKAAATLRKKLGALGQPKDKSQTGVVYLGRIPHGFYEEQMQAYFSQFGTVLRLRLSRNKKTGRSKHYAFIEFASVDVAEIVAETMDNYLLFGHQLKCKALQPSQIHPAMFLGANKKFKAIPWLKISKEKHNADKSPGQVNLIKKKLLKNEKAKRAKLQELGIDYEFPGYQASVPEKPKHTKF